MGSSTHPYKGVYEQVPFTFINGQIVYYVWNRELRKWVLPK